MDKRTQFTFAIFSQGDLLKQSFQQPTPLTLIISGLDENTIFCRLWLKGENC